MGARPPLPGNHSRYPGTACAAAIEGTYIPLASWAELIPKFSSLVRRQNPQICHAHDLNALIPGYIASRLTGSRLIYDSHEFETGRTVERSGSSALRRKGW